MGVVVFCSLVNPLFFSKKGRVGLAKFTTLKNKVSPYLIRVAHM